jgi:6-aminohexanoate-oligomer endohydrolase
MRSLPILPLLLILLTCKGQSMEAAVVKTKFKNLEVGVAVNPEGPTGTTVMFFPRGAYAASDIRGGAVATREDSAVSTENNWGWIDGLVFSGGSTFGLAAVDGVMESILQMRGGKINFSTIPAVPGAIVYDFSKRDNSVYPTKELGAEAFANRKRGQIPYGRVGAGVNVSVGKWFDDLSSEFTGQGVAYFEQDGVKVAVIVVLNAVGNIVNERGEVIRGSLNEQTGERVDIATRLKADKLKSTPKEGNTTITAVITNVSFDRLELKRLATMAHTSMARVIHPFHTPWDGDVLFAVSTREIKKPKDISVANVAVIASDLLKEAVLQVSTGPETDSKNSKLPLKE